MPHLKVSRLSQKYELVVRCGDTEEQAVEKAEEALSYTKLVRNPLDKILEVRETRNGGFPFEATITYLSSKYNSELTVLEKRQLSGICSKIAIVDEDHTSTAHKIAALKEADKLYEIIPCEFLLWAVDIVEARNPDLLLVRHNNTHRDGFDVMKDLRAKSRLQTTVVYGNASLDVIRDYHKIDEVLYFVRDPLDSQIVSAAENALNGVKAKDFYEFFIP